MSDTILLSISQLQGHYNNAKDMVIARLNRDHNLKIDPVDYIFVAHQKSCLGKLWDKVFGTPEKDTTSIQLLAVNHERSEKNENKKKYN